MTGPSQAFEMGQDVEIIGPSCSGNIGHFGERFEITQMWSPERDEYSARGLPWYPASSLRLVEPELKIGDWVEVISEGYVKGKILQIKALKDSCGQVLAGNIYFGPDSLRKLTPEEVAKHLAPPINTAQNQFNERTEARLDAIEKRQAKIEEALQERARVDCLQFAATTKVLGAIPAMTDALRADIQKGEKRLAFLEAYQRAEDNKK